MNQERIKELEAILKVLCDDEYEYEADGHRAPQALRHRIAEVQRELKHLKGE